ncbi:hypothetical protein Q3A66_09125 [Hymenobacter sp. BT770]|uniref:hypothetical protein n=1 Tax=Hymenobacter sp. BT770 TaxID=2886942 RepID=UPI001D12821E|nr:hypothetical protein [Hymenobacter sp. BT770]MCC3152089.1 hypothetical protein [Hymenobacter sp. BT770]MDO3415228.1 hypothetical protein [Hymenobacter sp. BT770]
MLYLLRDILFPVVVFLHAVLIGAPANHGRGPFRHAAYRVRRAGRLPHSLRESSGLARADSLRGLWTQGDGGTPPVLTLVALPGTILGTLDLTPLPNRDWEDLTQDPAGRLYIGDFGNNDNERQDLAIYRVNPHQAHAVVDTIAFRYPDQRAFPPPRGRRNFDCEAFFWYRDTLHLFSKDRSRRQWTKHYVLPARPGHYVATLLDSIQLNRPITAADISPDGRTVALLGYGGVFLFGGPPGPHLFDGPKRFRALPTSGQAEGLVFLDDSTFVVSNEQGRLYRATPR